MLQQHRSNILTGCLNSHSANFIGCARHTVNHTGFPILADGIGAGLTHFQQTVGAVPAHAGHNDANHMTLHGGCHGGEQRVHRRTVTADLFARLAGNRIPAAHPHHPHLQVRGSNEGQTRPDFITVNRLPDFHLTKTVQSVGVHFGEAHRHVLYDDHAGNIRRKPPQHFQRGLGAAGGSAQTDDGGLGQTSLGTAQQRGRSRNRAPCGRAVGYSGTGGHQHLLSKGQQKRRVGMGTIGLADKVHSTGAQGVKNPQVQRRYENHRQRVLRQKLRQKLNTALPRHFHIHRHHIGMQREDFVACVGGVHGCSHNLNPGMLGQSLGNQIPRHGRIVHHQYPNRLIVCDHVSEAFFPVTLPRHFFW